MVNVRTGNETEPAPEEKPLGKRILVVGAGPAGMEAARVAATRGAEVTLMERNPYLGGQFNLAGTPSNRKTFLNLIRYYKNELKRLGVEIRLGEEVTPTASLIEEVDAVILATGGRSLKPNIPGAELPHVMTAWEVLEGNREAFGNVVIIGGGATGCAAAIYISDKKKVPYDAAAYLDSRGITPPEPRMKPNITVLEMLKRIGTDIGLTTRWVNLQELNLRSIRMITKVEVKSIEPKAVVHQDEKGVEHRVPADCVVLAIGVESVNPLEEPLSKKTTELHVIGDAKEPRKAMEAIREGYRTAMELT
jgi:2,4-dienoyl-CoA reductase (NADPH2)